MRSSAKVLGVRLRRVDSVTVNIRHYPLTRTVAVDTRLMLSRLGPQLNDDISTGRPIGPVLFCSLVSVVRCRRLLAASSVTLPVGGRANRRARGRSGGRHCTAGQYGYVSLGRHLVSPKIVCMTIMLLCMRIISMLVLFVYISRSLKHFYF